MEKGAVFRALMWSLVAFFAWVFVSRLIWPLPPQSQVATTQPAEGADGSAVEGGQETTSAPAGSAVSPASTMPATPKYTARGGDTPQSITLGDVTAQQDSPFRMQVQLTSSGASVSNVMLADFAKDVDKPDRYPLLSPVSAEGDRTLTSLPIEKVTIDGQETWLRDVIWAVADAADVPQGASAARFVVDIVNGSDQPVLSLAYDYVLPQQALADQRYDLNTSLTLQNRDQVPHTVVVTMAGPVGIHKEDPRTDYRAVTAAAGEPGEVEAHTANYRDLNRHSEKTIHAVGDEEPLIWAAVDNKFFSCTLAPVGADGRQVGDYVAEARAVDLDGDGETTDDRTFQLVSKVCIMPAGTSETIRLACYLGPKDRHIFRDEDKNPDYVRRNYSLQITRMYTWCTFSWLAELMIALLTALHRVVFNYGVAIIILVLIVRTLLHPITKKGQVNMMKMQKQMGKLTPKMEELKKKYANDKAKLNQEMQNLYRSEGINPAGQMLTCLPMMIQMPIWVALWTSLNNNIAMRHEPFVLWIRDLTSPDGLIHFGGAGYHVPLLGSMIGPVTALNIVPLLLGVTMYVQQKLMPKPKPQAQTSSQSDQAAMMQKMMPVMSVFFALILYNAPSGLTLYIMASTLFGTIEQIRIRKHIKELEAGGGMTTAADKPKEPRGPLWLQRIKQQAGDHIRQAQKRAEDAQKLRRK